MITTKYNYFKVIQQRYTSYWEDASQYETNSQGSPIDRQRLLHDLREYKMLGYPTRVVQRRELIID